MICADTYADALTWTADERRAFRRETAIFLTYHGAALDPHDVAVLASEIAATRAADDAATRA